MSSELVYVGLDVAKATLDVALRPSGECWQAANDDAGVADLVARLRALAPTLIVCEATGGFEPPAVAACAAVGPPLLVANPRQVPDLAPSKGQPAETHPLDPRVLALLAQPGSPPPR